MEETIAKPTTSDVTPIPSQEEAAVPPAQPAPRPAPPVHINAPKGVADVLPEQVPAWRHVEQILRETMETGGFQEIRLPIFEYSQLFSRGIGDHTDIVEKEMYSFRDRGGRSLSLRPEGTASAVRSYLEHRLYEKYPICRLYYIGPMFRAERPQAGRYRQFHQLGAEVLGEASPIVDAEVIGLLMQGLSSLRLENLELNINSLGCPRCRPDYRQELMEFMTAQTGLCEDCVKRAKTNPLRVFDCKQKTCQEVIKSAPKSLGNLCPECRNHFQHVTDLLDEMQVAYKINPRLVRGLDYYTRTAFEILSGSLGAQNAIAGGGRYDGLVELLGGQPTPAFGFAIGMERLLLAMGDKLSVKSHNPLVYLALLGEEAHLKGIGILQSLRQRKINTVMNCVDQPLKKQLSKASKLGADLAVIVGSEELAKKKVVLRDMHHASQEDVPMRQLSAKINAMLRKGTNGKSR